jgi:glutamate N-acetyltransferase/amino-acid N-acetyltransferase
MSVKPESGGVCAPQGFLAAGMHCGLAKKAEKKDLALIYSQVPCAAAAVYTKNKVKASPLEVTRQHLSDGKAQAILCNSGNANACNADGMEVAWRMCKAAAKALRVSPKDVVVASTGVIGQPLPVKLVEKAVPRLKSALSQQGSADAKAAIMTTDLLEKEIAVSFLLEDNVCKIGGIAKGSGMIHPNMGTMLAFLTTDVDISPAMLQQALDTVVPNTFNMVSVDGDTSTNDMAVVLANGMAKNTPITGPGPEYDTFLKALTHVCIYLARMIAKDGEGATKLLECMVSGAPDEDTAKVLAKSVICSNLFKAAMFGADANWGRVLCALGYADAEFDVSKVKVSFVSSAGRVTVCDRGAGVSFSEEEAKQVLLENEIEIHVELFQGEGCAVAWGCDLSYDYVKINGDYRS